MIHYQLLKVEHQPDIVIPTSETIQLSGNSLEDIGTQIDLDEKVKKKLLKQGKTGYKTRNGGLIRLFLKQVL